MPPFTVRTAARYDRLAKALQQGQPKFSTYHRSALEILAADPYNTTRRHHIKKLEGVPPGQVVATPGALRALQATGQDPFQFLQCHASGDWGELCQEDKQENEFSLKHGFRILSAYRLSDGTKVWIITEADRSATTLLLPSEY